MERVVQVKRERSSGSFLMNPMCTFIGYGASVGVHPYIELSPTTLPTELGETAASLLGDSRATGVHIRDIERFRTTEGKDYEEVRRKYLGAIKSTRDAGRKYDLVEITESSKRRYWICVRMEYDVATKAMVTAQKLKVLQHDGEAALGAAILRLSRRQASSDRKGESSKGPRKHS